MNSKDWHRMSASLRESNARYGPKMVELGREEFPRPYSHVGPQRAWRSRDFFAALYEADCIGRLSINRTRILRNGRWDDGISWDEIQRIKAECGFADYWAVEVYPAQDCVVNVASMRHLFLLAEKPSFAWGKDDAAA